MAQTIAEMMIEIGVDTSDLDRSTRQMQNDMRGISTSVETLASNMDSSTAEMRRQWRSMSEEMRNAHRQNAAALAPFRQQQQQIKYEFFQMAQGMEEYQGTTSDFMGELTELGNRHRQVNDNMIRNNSMMRMSFIQGIATMLARSTASSKIAANFSRMRNPLYQVNNGLLAISGGLERMAARGQPAVLALRMLGPTANMKALNDMTRMITAGIMRMQMVAMGAAIVGGVLYAQLAKAAYKSVPAFKQAADEMKASLVKAFEPMVQAFAAIVTPIMKVVTAISNLAIKFNEAYPLAAKIIQGILMLIPLLTLILSPLAIGIGLWNGILAAWGAISALIMPLITGLAAMSGTILIVAGVLVGLGVALWALWTKTDWFKSGIISIWEAIKSATQSAWNFILNSVLLPIWNAMLNLGNQLFNQLKDFWKENGDNILAIGQFIWSFIKTYIISEITILVATLKVLFNILSAVVQSVWGNIKGAISGAVNIILGIIGFFVSIFTGDWKGAWENAKKIIEGAWKIISNLATLGVNALLGVVRGLGKSIGGEFGKIAESFYKAGKGFMEMLVKGIESALGKVLNTIGKVAGKVRDFLPFSPAKTGPLSDLDHLDFGGPITDSIHKAVPMVKGLMSELLTMPSINAQVDKTSINNSGNAGSDNRPIELVINLDSYEVARATYPHIDDLQANGFNNGLRTAGVR